MRTLLCSLSLACQLCMVSAAQEVHPLAGVGLATYTCTFGEKATGREQARFRADGWSVEGQIEQSGESVAYSAGWTRLGPDAGEWVVEYESGSYRCEWNGTSIRVFQDAAQSPTATVEWVHEAAPVFFANANWTVLSELAVRLFASEDVRAGDTVVLFMPRLAEELTATVESIEARQWQRQPNQTPIELRDLALDIDGVGMLMTCTSEGLLLNLAVPSQRIEAVCSGYEGAAPAGNTLFDPGPWRALRSKPVHQFTRLHALRAAMRDGVELATEVFLPTGDGPWPTVLVRTPYDRQKAGGFLGRFWARRGYAFVVQDVRGCFDSGGEWAPALHERDDGSDTLDWIAAQDWSDGNVGMIGGSYSGWVQLLAAASGNPHLKAIVPQVAPPDPLKAFPYEGGAFQLGVAWWALAVDHMASRAEGPAPTFEWTDVFATLPLTDLDKQLGIEQAFLDEWLTHPPSDNQFWDRLSYQQDLDEMEVAALHITGWYDGDLPGALENFSELRTQAKSLPARSGQFLVVGPWGHAFNQSRRIGPVDFGPDALVDLDAVYVRFFDRYLKGVENGIEDLDPVLVFVMGANEWHSDVAWPLPRTRFTRLLLGSDGDARTRSGDGRMALAQSGDAVADVFAYDPADPPPTPEVTFGDPLKNSRMMDLSGTVDRMDVLDYTTPALAAPVELTGPVVAKVWIETDVEDTDVFVKLVRVEADGTVRRITGGIQRVRYRNGPGTDAPVAPGTPVCVSVQLRATSIALEPGERLRLEVSSAEFPSFAPNPNTLEPAASKAELRVATTRVLHDQEHPSHLLLPVVSRGPGSQPLRFEPR